MIYNVTSLSFDHVSQSSDGRSDSGSGSGRNGVSTTSNGLLTRRTVPDTGSTSFDSLLTTEGTVVSGVLLHFQLLDLSSQRRTVTDTVLTSDTNLLSSLSPVKISLVSKSFLMSSSSDRCRVMLHTPGVTCSGPASND